MENNTTPGNGITVDITEKRERSNAYPADLISDSEIFVRKIHGFFPNSTALIKREDIAGLVKGSRNILRDISTAVQYGWLAMIRGEGYRITPAFKKLLSGNRQEALLDAFQHPKLYKALITEYNGHVVPKELSVILVQFHGITQKVSDEAATIFIQNAKDVGALNEHGILNCDSPVIETTETENNTVNEREQTTAEILVTEQKAEIPIINNLVKPEPQLALSDYTKNEKIELTGEKIIDITFPKKMAPTDMLIFEKWLEMLKLRMQ